MVKYFRDPDNLAQPLSEQEEFIEETIQARKNAVFLYRLAASRGDSLAGMLANLEGLTSPFFLGIDEDGDDSDMEVFP